MAAGKPLTARQRRRIERAVSVAEDFTGLEFCAYVGPIEGDPHAYAEALFAELGLSDRPGVLVLVAPAERKFEILLSRTATERIGERDCLLAAAALRASFAVGDLAGGIAEGVRLLAQTAGPSTGARPARLPDLIGPAAGPA